MPWLGWTSATARALSWGGALPTSASAIAQPEGECHRFVVFVSPCARTVGVQVSRRARRAGVIELESHPINGVLNHAL